MSTAPAQAPAEMMFDMGNKTPLLAVLLAVVSAGVFTDYYANLWTRLRSTLGTYPSSANYTVQLFSTDPVVLHVRDFMSEDEINHVLSLAKGRYETSRVWGTGQLGQVEKDIRDSESAVVARDHVVERIEHRARSFLGWRNNATFIQPLKTQIYRFNGFYSFHYDWVAPSDEFPGNRMTTFMVYLEADCTGGGTNFPRLPRPQDGRWCDVIACEGDVEYDEYPGVTFRAIRGSAVFWDNFHPDGTPHRATRHAGLPVRSGHKTGMNIWSWDNSWRDPESSK